MNRSFRAEDKGTQAALKQQRQLMCGLRASMMKEKDEDLALFLEMRKREKERNNLLLLQNSEEFDTSVGLEEGSYPIFNIASATPARKTGADDFLNSENDKNDYEWLLTPPGTPLFPSLEMESPKTMMSQLGTLKAQPTALKSRLANQQPEPAARGNLASRQTASSPVLNTSTAGICKPSLSGGSGSRPATPTGRPLLSTASKSSSSTCKSTLTATSKPISITGSKPSRSSTPTSRTTLPSSKPTVLARSSTPTGRSTARSSTPTERSTVRSSTPTERSTVRSSTPTVKSSARSSTPTTKLLVAASKAPSRSATPTRKPITPKVANACAPPVRSPPSSSVTKPAPSTSRNPVPPRASSPTVKPRLWKPSEMPGFSLDAPPNLRTSLPERPISATRGRPGAPMVRSSSIEPLSNGRVRRQSCSPARGRPPNGIAHGSGSSVPAMNRAYAKANDNDSPGVVGTKMVERVINMRKLAPPKQDDKHSPHSNISGKSSSPDSSGFGRTLSKKSLDMAIRHMDIRRRLPGSIRPSVANIPASAMYSVRSGYSKSSTAGISGSPLATSSNGSSEVSVNNNALCVDGSMFDDAISNKGIR